MIKKILILFALSGLMMFACLPPGGLDYHKADSDVGSRATASIVVRARGTIGSEQIRLTVGGGTVTTWTLSTSMNNYSASTSNTGGINVQFINDGTNMDVQVDYITVNGATRQAEAQSSNTGVYQNGRCGGSNSEWLHCNGYIGFGDIGGTVTATPTGVPTATPTRAPTNTPTGYSGYVYLCFDDGPTGSTTTLVNNLKNAGAKATFFIWGNRISGNQAGWNAIKSAGFSIQNHTYTHSHMTSWSYQQVYNDIQQGNQAIQNGGAGKPSRIRLPYLESNSTIQQACSALGLSIVQPSVDTKDWNGAGTSAIVSACNSLQNGGNALMHDGYSTTNAAISQIVTNLKNRSLGTTQY